MADYQYDEHPELSPDKTGAFKASQMPIKAKIKAIETGMGDAKKGLAENKKEVQILRSEFVTLEHKQKEITNEMLKEMLEDIAHIEKDFKKNVNHDTNEYNYLKQQLAHLSSEKAKIHQDSIILNTRIESVENDVGFE